MVRWRELFDQALAVATKPNAKRAVGVFLAIGKQQRQIIGDGLIDPLIAVVAPADDIAPPLVRHFVKRNELCEMLLPGVRQAGAALRGGRQERKGGKIQQAGPALPERAGDLRDAKFLEPKGSAERFVEANGRVDFAAELLERVRGTRRGWNDRHHLRGYLALRAEGQMHRRRIQARSTQAVGERLLDEAVGINIDRASSGSERGESVITQIETRDG